MPWYQGAFERRVRSWFGRTRTRRQRTVRLALLVAPFALAAACGVSLCPLALLASVPCPGCGLTRSAWALLSGDFARALSLNPLSPVVCPLFGGGLAFLAGRYIWTGTMRLSRWAIVGAIALNIALVVVWVARFFGMFGGPVAV